MRTGLVFCMLEVQKMAQDRGRVCYLYESSSGYEASFTMWDDWLFKAYPGGRKQFSMTGKQHAQDAGILDDPEMRRGAG